MQSGPRVTDTYSYGTCVDETAPYPGIVPGSLFSGDPSTWLGEGLAGLVSPECLRTLVYGNTTITPIFDWTTGVGAPN